MGVSKKHAHLRYEHRQLVLTDLNSTNGVFIGTRRISQEAIDNGTTFTLGAYQVKVEAQVRCSQPTTPALITQAEDTLDTLIANNTPSPATEASTTNPEDNTNNANNGGRRQQ